MIYTNRAQAKKLTGLTYLGKVNSSTKHEKAYNYKELVYTLYLAPAKMSGYEVCPMRSKECTQLCLNKSGKNIGDMSDGRIDKSRIKKTKLFFEHREFFVRWMIDEITELKKRAESTGHNFSIRLNNTSDISPESFYIDDNGTKKNILELFPDAQFYDYTKVPKRLELVKKYENYDLTFSYSGTNFQDCITMLNNGVRVAVVFKDVPQTFWGREVIDGDLYDMRYRDGKDVIVGLKFKIVKNKLTSTNKFVIQ